MNEHKLNINIYETEPIVQLSLELENEIGNTQYNDLINTSKNIFGIDLTYNKTPLRAVLLHQQYIEPRWGFVFNEGKVYVVQSGYLKPDSLIDNLVNKDVKGAIKLNEEYVYFMAYNHDYANYYHWTVQCFPSLGLYLSLKSLYAKIKILLPANIPEFALQYLKAMQIDIEKEVEFLPVQDRLFFANKLIYPSIIGGEFSFNTSQTLLNFSSSFFERNLKNGSSAFNLFSKEKSKVLYCSRLDSPNRKITNEGALVDLLKNKFNARIFISTGQSVKEQAKRFYESDVIIAPHGAGMSNVIYCHRNATVIEFMPDKYINPCFATLAINKGCNYLPFVFPTKLFDGHQHDYEWEIDIDAIENILTKLI